MESFISAFLVICAAIVAAPVTIFFIEVIAAIASSRRGSSVGMSRDPNHNVAVLVPAHNESAGLLPTIIDIKRQLSASDRLLVVADNCTDDTAAIAAARGAEVIERNDPSRRGKGYALDFGVRHLNQDPPSVVIVVDADCRLSNNAISELAAVCLATGRPAQALDLMKAPAVSQINHQVAEFAWRVKNWLRPLGLMALGLPCQLMGTGMAFPWAVICKADLANGWVVEDLKLGLDLASSGHAPVFCPSALVTSQFAPSARAARTQRERWERGHISMIVTIVPRLLLRALVSRNWSLIALTLDLAVPPLSLLALLAMGMAAVAAVCNFLGVSSSALILSTGALLVFLFTAFLAWLKCGRDVVPIGSVLSIPLYILGKLGLYRIKVSNKTAAQWIRTDRAESE